MRNEPRIKTFARFAVRGLGVGAAPWALALLLVGCGGGGAGGGDPTNRGPNSSFIATPSDVAPRMMSFDGSASSDPDGTITKYTWEFGDGVMTSGASPTIMHQYASEGTYTVVLTVTDNDGVDVGGHSLVTVSRPAVAQWLGEYESSLIKDNALYSEISQTGDTFSGTYRDEKGREGTLSGTISGANVTLQMIETTPGCGGSFDGSGTVDPNFDLGTDTILFDFTGTDCAGSHSDGSAYLTLQQSKVLAWGQHNPAGLTQRDGSLFWTDDSAEPLKKLDITTGVTSALTIRTGTTTALTVDGTQLLWIDAHGGGDAGCTLMLAATDGANPRTLTNVDTCGATPGREELAADASYVYWARSPSNGVWVIDRVPLSGGDPEQIAVPTQNAFKGLAIDQSFVYWGEVVSAAYSKIRRCPLTGCGQNAPDTILQTDATVTLWTDIVVAGDRIWFGLIRSSVGPEVSSMPKAGGAITDFVLASDYVARVLVDANTVYWLSGNTLFSKPLAGGATTALVNNFYYWQGIAFGSSRVYWGGSASQTVFQDGIYYVDKAGGSVGKLASAASPLFVEVDDGGNVIYADGGPVGAPNGIYRVTPAGTVTGLFVGLAGASPLAVDNQFVYGAQGNNIKRVSLDGGNATLVAPADFHPIAMQADNGYVYWLNESTGQIQRAFGGETGFAEPVGIGGDLSTCIDIHDGYLYSVSNPEGNAQRVPVGGGTVETLATGLAFPVCVVADDNFIYVIEADAEHLTKIALADGKRTMIGSVGHNYGWYTMTQDATNIYFSTPAGLFRTAKSGTSIVQTQYHVPVVAQNLTPGPIAVDDHYLYWTEIGTGAIKREPK